MGSQYCGLPTPPARSTSEVMIITTARGSPAGMLAEPVVCDQLLAGHVPPLPPPVHLLPSSAPTILSTRVQTIFTRRDPGVVFTQSCWLPLGHGGPGGVPHVF